jgi:hypothetical protein
MFNNDKSKDFYTLNYENNEVINIAAEDKTNYGK